MARLDIKTREIAGNGREGTIKDYTIKTYQPLD